MFNEKSAEGLSKMLLYQSQSSNTATVTEDYSTDFAAFND